MENFCGLNNISKLSVMRSQWKVFLAFAAVKLHSTCIFTDNNNSKIFRNKNILLTHMLLRTKCCTTQIPLC